ncbi:hypothetical protein MPSEU_000589900 [Mayamaea pseudoterrestris]|nr:hypothetical protein MPSEU_000589900 [Mayamaea pseudoterrestris]
MAASPSSPTDKTMILALSQRANQWLGKFLLKQGIKARFALERGGIVRHRPWLDQLCLLPIAMRLVSLESYEQGQQAVNDAMQKQQKTQHTPESLGAIRLKVLESYVRPALLPNEQWNDVSKWRFHPQVVQWLRREFLLAKHRDHVRAALDAFTSLRQSPQLSKSSSLFSSSSLLTRIASGKLPFDKSNTKDNGPQESSKQSKLPSSELIRQAFDMRNWNDGKDHSATGFHMRHVAQRLGGNVVDCERGSGLRIADIPPHVDLTKVSLGDVLEVAGGHVHYLGSFNALCVQIHVYQLWTREYIDALGTYLLNRTATFDGDTLLLEVGAGDGVLSASLAEYFDATNRPTKAAKADRKKLKKWQTQARPSQIKTTKRKLPLVVATDDQSWGLAPHKSDFVKTMSVEQALETFVVTNQRQVIVLCSWMPMNEDWTATFRKYGVDEYILIGECDNGQCGDNWLTWGNPAFQPIDSPADVDEPSDAAVSSMKRSIPTMMKPYESQGYTRHNMNALAAFQYSRFDCSVSKQGRTASFRKSRR